MERTVGRIGREPPAVGKSGVLLLRCMGKAENACRLFSVENEKALSPLDIREEVLRGGIRPLPLVNMPPGEDGARIGNHGKDHREIIHCCRAAGQRLRQREAGGIPGNLPEELLICWGRKICLFKHIRTFGLCADELLLAAPVGDLCMVAIQEHFRHVEALPFFRAGVLRVFQKPVPMAFFGIALLIGEDTRHETADGICDRHGSNLATGKDKITKGELFIHAGFNKALVHAFIMAADKDEMVIITIEAFSRLLCERRALRREVNDAGGKPFSRREDMIQALF